MLRALVTADPILRDALISRLSLKKNIHTESSEGVIFYQKEAWIVAYHPTSLSIAEAEICQEYAPERVYVLFSGRSIDADHEIGDVILPNVFFECSPDIQTTEIDATNRDSFCGKPVFLEIFEDQRDYYVENFGLSIGGIVVSQTPHESELDEKLMLAYEADIYTLAPLQSVLDARGASTIFVAGVMHGKVPMGIRDNHADFLAENMITTIGLFEDDRADV